MVKIGFGSRWVRLLRAPATNFTCCAESAASAAPRGRRLFRRALHRTQKVSCPGPSDRSSIRSGNDSGSPCAPATNEESKQEPDDCPATSTDRREGED